MFCSNCGTQCEEGNNFCDNCRSPLPDQSTLSSTAISASTMTRTNAVSSSITLQIPVRSELSASLMFWTGHVLAVIGWIVAITLWVQSGKPLANIPTGDIFGEANINIGNPFKNMEILLGFLALITGHVLQIVFFWASELLNAVRMKA